MKIQKSFKEERPTLYIVATPIGNLSEMTPRAIETLNKVDIIAAEDTRTTGKLLDHFDIQTQTIAYHMHNEKKSTSGIIKLLDEGKSVALVSDAGYPLISDPGQTLVSEVIAKGYPVVPISGSSAFLNALVASGLVTQPFSFMGFLETKETLLKKQVRSIEAIEHTLIFYVSVHRVEKTLKTIHNILGNRQVCLAREITKLHEEFIRTDLESLLETEITLKGEFVLILEGNNKSEEISIEALLMEVEQEILEGMSPSRSITKIAKQYNISKNELYNEYLIKRN